MPKQQQPRRIKFSHSARGVFEKLDDRRATEVVVCLDGLAASPAASDPRDGWSVLPGAVRVCYRVTKDAVIVHAIIVA